MVRLLKRYGSRKLYETEESRYVSLEELATWIREGQQIRVLDKDTGEDVTSHTLTQVIVEAGRRDSAFPPSDVLHEMIRRGGEFFSTGVEQIGSGLDRLLRAGADHVPPLRQVREETEVLPRRLEISRRRCAPWSNVTSDNKNTKPRPGPRHPAYRSGRDEARVMR